MSSNANDNKAEATPTFGILPHPAKTNDPNDLQPAQPGGGLRSSGPEFGAFHARGPFIPAPHIMSNLPPPLSREELRARQEELNRES